jgi:hypothetical protein
VIVVLILLGGLFVYVLIYKPELIAILLFTLTIANVNFDLSGLPLNTRAIITLALFGRILADKKGLVKYPPFLRQSAVKILIIYFLYILFISFGQGIFTMELLKLSVSTILTVFCVYHYFFTSNDDRLLKAGLILSGLICVADLIYTYTVFGSFPVQRLYLLITGTSNDESSMDYYETNHNFFGQICGMCFVFLFTDVIKNRNAKPYTLLLLPIMFLGVLMSTSRSALMGMIVILLIIIIKGISSREQRKRAYRIAGFSIMAIIAVILAFTAMNHYFNLDSKFMNQIGARLVDEPVAILKRSMGKNYNIDNMDSMDWRGEAAADAYDAYLHLDITEQVFGIGSGGFLARDLGHGLNPHNGVLLILIETGLVGFLLYLFIISSVILKSVKLNNISPSLAVLGFILVYGVGQNQELTSLTTFLFVVTLIAENQHILAEKRERFHQAQEIQA